MSTSSFENLQFTFSGGSMLIPLAALPFAETMEFKEMVPSSILVLPPNYRFILFPETDGIHPNDIECVMIQANVSRDEAVNALRKHKNIVDAILACDDSPPDFKLEIEKYAGSECVCSMCLDNIENGSDIHRLPCNHVFHAHNCLGDKGIVNWIEDHKTCPYCRAKIDMQKKIGNEDGLDQEEIQIVMTQASCSRKDAVKSLKKHGNIVDAVLEIIP